MSYGVLVDISRCMGCRSCQVACKQWNNIPSTPTTFQNNRDNPPELNATNWTKVGHYLIEDQGSLKWRFVKRQCMHCSEPACESACFTHSFVKTKEGAVIYKPTEVNQDYCAGCRYCMVACPFDVPKSQWDRAFPLLQKCRFCYDRLKQGVQPACVTACPTESLFFADREAVLAEGWKRINDNPAYIKHVYGEKEYGGTSWLYISDVPFEKLGFKTGVTQRSIPSFSWPITRVTPYIFFGWGAILSGLYWYTKRRAEVQNEENQHREGQGG